MKVRVIVVVNILQATNAKVTMKDEYLEVTTDNGDIRESVTQYLAVKVRRANGELLPLRLCRVEGRNQWQVRYSDDQHGLNNLRHAHRWVWELVGDRGQLMNAVAAGCVFSVFAKGGEEAHTIRVGDELRVEPRLSISYKEPILDGEASMSGKSLGIVAAITVTDY